MPKMCQFILRVKRTVTEEYVVDATDPIEAEELFKAGIGNLSHEVDGDTESVEVTHFDDGSKQRDISAWPPSKAKMFRKSKKGG